MMIAARLRQTIATQQLLRRSCVVVRLKESDVISTAARNGSATAEGSMPDDSSQGSKAAAVITLTFSPSSPIGLHLYAATQHHQLQPRLSYHTSAITQSSSSSVISSTSSSTNSTAGGSSSSVDSSERKHQPHLIASSSGQQKRLDSTAVKPEPPSYESDLVVVLDMDECLIHSKFLSSSTSAAASRMAHQVRRRQEEEDEAIRNRNPERVDSFHISLPDGDVVHVLERPHLQDFLQVVCNRYETHIFTAAMDVYAKPVLDTLDPTNTMFAGRWYRESCQPPSTTRGGAYVKDLGFLKKRMERLVLVDNNPLSFLANPLNGVLVKSFYDDPSDTTLLGVLELLEELEEHDDVRPVLDRKFSLKRALQELNKNQ